MEMSDTLGSSFMGMLLWCLVKCTGKQKMYEYVKSTSNIRYRGCHLAMTDVPASTSNSMLALFENFIEG